MAARTNQEETHKLAAYGMIILQLVLKHRESGWLLYDKKLRVQQAAGAGLYLGQTSTRL